jgi:transposase
MLIQLFKNNVFIFIQFCFEIETGPKLEQGECVGIDTGINALASENTGKQYGLEVKQHIERVKRNAISHTLIDNSSWDHGWHD